MEGRNGRRQEGRQGRRVGERQRRPKAGWEGDKGA